MKILISNKRTISPYGLMVLFLFALSACGTDNIKPGDPTVDLAELPYEKLTDYNFFQGVLAELTPNDGILPYELNTPLFSDYSAKDRFIWMPAGASTVYTEDGAFDFPPGTILIKNFAFENDFRDPLQGRNNIEIRMMIRKQNEWEAATYIWNEDQDEAFFSVVGEQVNISWTHYDGSPRSTLYLIPNKNDCKSCHNILEKLVPVGPKARNLNREMNYADGTTENQLTKWAEAGFLTGVPDPTAAPKLAVWDDPASGSLNERARAYLDVNCAHCHNPNGPVDNSGLSLHYNETDSTAFGLCKAPVAAGAGSGGLQYGIVPGEPDSSIMIFRMNSTELDIAMPELGRSVIHDEGVALIREWIAGIEGKCD